jgi:hypothetical protein
MDITSVCLILGGPKLVYTMSKALNLPSLRTIQSKAKSPCVSPCLATPTHQEVENNIVALFGPDLGAPSIPHCGYVIMIDEVALEERPCYDSQHDMVLGICQEHSGCCDLNVSSISTLLEIQLALRDGSIHRAKEATVVSLTPFLATHYSPNPIMLSGTCKSEKDPWTKHHLSLASRATTFPSPSKMCTGVLQSKMYLTQQEISTWVRQDQIDWKVILVDIIQLIHRTLTSCNLVIMLALYAHFQLSLQGSLPGTGDINIYILRGLKVSITQTLLLGQGMLALNMSVC